MQAALAAGCLRCNSQPSRELGTPAPCALLQIECAEGLHVCDAVVADVQLVVDYSDFVIPLDEPVDVRHADSGDLANLLDDHEPVREVRGEVARVEIRNKKCAGRRVSRALCR